MTLDEARAELGIDPSASSDEARRAYLRGVKTRKPETDPEGFRRLREAYERLTAGATLVFGEGPYEEEEEEEDASLDLESLAARLRNLPVATHLNERLALLREGAREFPASAGLRWWLVEELDQAGRTWEILEVMREAGAAGLPGFLEARAVRFPASIDPADLARLDASPDPDILALRARVHLEQSRPDDAAAALAEALDRLWNLEADEYRSVPAQLPRGILALEAEGSTVDAWGLYKRLCVWLADTGDAALLELWNDNDPLRLLHELKGLDSSFPQELRQAAAMAVLSEDVRPAVEAARRYAARDPEEAEAVLILLAERPMLQDLYASILQRDPPAAKGAKWSQHLWAKALLYFFFGTTVMLLASLWKSC
ncbi:MAG TPA: J domain-containing protein [Thermoanaerobaculia bacterium]